MSEFPARRLIIISACIVAISVIGLIAAIAQYHANERQVTAANSLALIQSSFAIANVRSGPSAGIPESSVLQEYQANIQKVAQAIALTAETSTKFLKLIIAAWALVLTIGSVNLLIVYSLRRHSD